MLVICKDALCYSVRNENYLPSSRIPKGLSFATVAIHKLPLIMDELSVKT